MSEQPPQDPAPARVRATLDALVRDIRSGDHGQRSVAAMEELIGHAPR